MRGFGIKLKLKLKGHMPEISPTKSGKVGPRLYLIEKNKKEDVSQKRGIPVNGKTLLVPGAEQFSNTNNFFIQGPDN